MFFILLFFKVISSANLHKFWFYWELCGKAIKPLFFKVPLVARTAYIHPYSLIAVIRRVAVFFYRKGRGGFAEDAGASRPLRKVIGGCGSRPAAGSFRK
jgi:hypothetical protein